MQRFLRVLFGVGLLASAIPAGAGSTAQAADDDRFAGMYGDFVSVDRATGLFRNAQGLFAVPCVTYVQPERAKPGANSGTIQVLTFDLTKLRPDFRHMRENGVRGIYMRIGAGFFLNRDGSWRKVDDPMEGVWSWQKLDEEVPALRAKAAEAGIGPFTFNYEIFDYLLDCARAEGVYVIPMIMDGWSLPRKYDFVENGTAILYEDVWQRVIADWSRILGRLKDRRVILGYLVEGENHRLPCWNDNAWFFFEPEGPKVRVAFSPLEEKDPRLARQFRHFLKKRHGTIDALKARWRHGYDRDNPTYKNDIPIYPFKPGVFEGLASFEDIGLPTVERPRGPADLGPGKNFPWWLNVPLDPVWVEFAYFKEDLYIRRMNELFAGLRRVDPNHIFIVSAALDNVPVWHPFFVSWDIDRMECEVLLHGGGYANPYKRTPPDFAPHETVLELYQSVCPYRPFAVAGAGVMGGYGMGEGGLGLESTDPKAKTTHIPEQVQDRWIAGVLMDNFGSASAFASIWDWGTLTGATVDNMELHDHEALASIAAIARALAVDTFTRTRRARVLVLANGPSLHSIIKAVAYHNIIALSSVLAATHVPFDIVTTDEISFGAVHGKVDISRYDVIFMPQQFQIPLEQLSGGGLLRGSIDRTNPWVMLDKWLSARPNRVLCVGAMALNDAYFNPLSELPPSVRNVVGDVTPGVLEMVDGPQTWQVAGGDDLDVVLHYTRVQEIQMDETASTAAQVKPYITSEDRVLGVKRRLANDSKVYYFGFPLGLSWMHMMIEELRGGMLNEKFDIEKLAGFYGRLIDEAGVKPEYEAPPSVVAYISDDARAVFLRQRFTGGPRTGKLISSPRLAGHIYAGATTTQEQENGKSVGAVSCDLGENYSEVLISVGTAELAGDGTLSVAIAPAACGEERYEVELHGTVAATLSFGGIPQAQFHYVPRGKRILTVSVSPDRSARIVEQQ